MPRGGTSRQSPQWHTDYMPAKVRFIDRPGRFRTVGQYLGLVYQDNGSWKIFNRFPEDPATLRERAAAAAAAKTHRDDQETSN
jgi:hypothetical protein